MPDPRCTATSKRSGQPCKNRPMPGKTVCKQHTGDPNVGKPSSLTEDVMHRVCQLLRNGNPVSTSMRACGLHPDTYYGWLERGEADLEQGNNSLHAEFVGAATRARGEGQAVLVNLIRQSAQGSLRTDDQGRTVGSPGDWKAAAWILERTNPQEFGPRSESKVEHGGKVVSEIVEPPSDRERLNEVAQILGQVGALPEAA